MVELIFVASHFSRWHGLDLLIKAMQNNTEICILHVIGNASQHLKLQAANDSRIIFHGHLSSEKVCEISSRAWLGITSLALNRQGMNEACPLKTREYLYLGLAIYGNYADPALPTDFPYFYRGSASFSQILAFAKKMRTVSKSKIQEASEPFISKTILLNKLYDALVENLNA